MRGLQGSQLPRRATRCCRRTTRRRRSGSPTRTTPTSTTSRPAPTRSVSGCPYRNTRNGAFAGTEVAANTWPRRTPLRAFEGNTAHSNFDGFLIDRHIDEDNTFGLASLPLIPLTDPTDLESDVMETHFVNLTAYKNRNGGLWGRGDMYVYSNMKLADNAIGMTQAAGDIGSLPFSSRLVNSLVVGETDNIGNPTTPEEIAYRPQPAQDADPRFPDPRLRILRLSRRCGEHDVREFPGQRAAQDGRAVLPAVHERGAQHRKHHQRGEIHQRQAGLFPEIRQAVRQRQPRREPVSDPVDPRPGRFGDRHSRFPHRARRWRERQRRHRRHMRKPSQAGTPPCARATSAA